MRMRRVAAACAAALIVLCACSTFSRDGSESRVFLEEHDSVARLSSTLQSDESKLKKFLASTVEELQVSRRRGRGSRTGSVMGMAEAAKGQAKGVDDKADSLDVGMAAAAKGQAKGVDDKADSLDVLAESARMQMDAAEVERKKALKSEEERVQAARREREESEERAEKLREREIKASEAEEKHQQLQQQQQLTDKERAFVKRTMSSPTALSHHRRQQQQQQHIQDERHSLAQATTLTPEEALEKPVHGGASPHSATSTESAATASAAARHTPVDEREPRSVIAASNAGHRSHDANHLGYHGADQHYGPISAAKHPSSPHHPAAAAARGQGSTSSGLDWPKAVSKLQWPHNRGESLPSSSTSLRWPDGQSVELGAHAAAMLPSDLQVVMLIAGTTARALTSGRRDKLEKALTDKLGYGQQPSKMSIAYAVDVPGLDDQTEVSVHMGIPGGENCRVVAGSVARAIRTGELDEGLRALGDDGLQARLLAMSGCEKGAEAEAEEGKGKARDDSKQQEGGNGDPASGRKEEGGDEISTLRGAASDTDTGPFHREAAPESPRGISGASVGRRDDAQGGVKLPASASASVAGGVGERGVARKGGVSAIEEVAEATSQDVASRVARDAARLESESIRTGLMKMARRVARETASKVAEAALKARAHAGSDIVDAPGAMGKRSSGSASVAAKGTPRAARRLITMRGRDALSQLEEAAAKNRARHGPLK